MTIALIVTLAWTMVSAFAMGYVVGRDMQRQENGSDVDERRSR